MSHGETAAGCPLAARGLERRTIVLVKKICFIVVIIFIVVVCFKPTDVSGHRGKYHDVS